VTSFRVLGSVGAWSDERRLLLGGPQQVKLLAFLLLSANRATSADELIDAIWGAERDGAAKRLHMGVLRLRKALAPLDGPDGSRVRTVSGGYLLELGSGDLDAGVFTQRVRDGRRALEGGDPARASALLTGALGLWRGPPLAEVAFEDFAQAEIRRLEELRLVALETRIEADLQLGRDAELIAELDTLLVEQPTRERLAGQLMLALYRAGRQTQALDVYQRTRTHLAREVGLEPGPTLRRLQTQILEHASDLAPAQRAAARSPQSITTRPAPSRLQLCGRFGVELDGRRIEGLLPGHPSRVALAYLALNRLRPVPRDELASVLSGCPGSQGGDVALRRLLSRLRAILGETVLTGSSELSLVLDPETWIDYEAAHEAIHRAEADIARGRWDEAWWPTRIAHNVAHREFLPGAECQWVLQRRRDLQELKLRAYEAIVQVGLGIGGSELTSARRSAQAIVDGWPYRESGYCLLMRAFMATGDHAEGLLV
jgi:DNA-binding SARP family transcriptional activator